MMFCMSSCGRDINYIIQNEPCIIGTVTEVYDNSVLIKNETGEYYVSLDVENSDSCTSLNVGDGIYVYYDGSIAETYPMQIDTVYAILLIEPAERA